MGAGHLCKSQHNYTCNSVGHSHQNLSGLTGHLVPGEAHLVVILLRVAAGVSHGEAVAALGSGAPAATYLIEVSTRFYNIWR